MQSRPLNLFYGLSQAGRAVAAALTPPGRPSALNGHGLRCPGLADAASKGPSAFSNIEIRSQGPSTTSFRMLSDLLDSAPLDTAVYLGQLWAMVPEAAMHEPLEHKFPPALLTSAWRDGSNTVKVSVEGLEPGFDGTDLTNLVLAYPALQGMRFERVSGTNVSQTRKQTCSIELVDELARYHPEAWTAVTDVDKSSRAVPIEYLLDIAQGAVPDLLWRSIVP